MGITSFKARKQVVKEAVEEHRSRMLSLDDLPDWQKRLEQDAGEMRGVKVRDKKGQGNEKLEPTGEGGGPLR